MSQNDTELVTRLCECGCGRPTRTTRYACASSGYSAGEPQRFLKGHRRNGGRTRPIGTNYPTVKVGDAWRDVHRVRAERALGKPLPPRAVVHHADGTKRADAPLVICEDNAYHRLLHARIRVHAAGGDPNTDGYCKRHGVMPLESFQKDRECRRCKTDRQRQRRRVRRQEAA